MSLSIDHLYLHIAWWAQDGSWIELGYDDYSRPFIRVLDIGGILWEGSQKYATLSETMDEAESYIKMWCQENGYQP